MEGVNWLLFIIFKRLLDNNATSQQTNKLLAANVAGNDAQENSESAPSTVVLQVRNPVSLEVPWYTLHTKLYNMMNKSF